jgi:diketogulonate reductase-like aldo/keto reductase
MKLTPIGLGTWNIEHDPQTSKAALRTGLETGANHIDTAEMYGDGRAETVVGEAIAGLRDNVFLVSKVLPSNADYEGTLAACERSLKRLKTDYLDVYLLHWRDRRTELAETFRAFERLKTDGKIRAWGVSNFDAKDLDDALRIVAPADIACNQVLYHLEERAIESKVLPWCRDHNVSVVAYSPLGQGRLPRHTVLDEIARRHDASPAQIALAFLTRDPSVFAVPKSSDAKRVHENVQAMDVQLSAEDIRRLDAAFPLKPKKSLPTL